MLDDIDKHILDCIEKQPHRVTITNIHGLWVAKCREKCGWKRSHQYYYELKPMIERHYEKHENN